MIVLLSCSILWILFVETNSLPKWLIPKTKWLGDKTIISCEERFMDLPLRTVIVFHTSRGHCSTYKTCLKEVKALFTSMGDIQYHYLIGADGSVFEGLPEYCKSKQLYLNFPSLQIGMIGNYSKDGDSLSNKQIVALNDLLNYEQSKNKLFTNYELTPSCCYINMTGPGTNILKEIIKHEHFLKACLKSATVSYTHLLIRISCQEFLSQPLIKSTT